MTAPSENAARPDTDHDVLVVGAGFAGLRALHHLRDEKGLRVHVVEAGDDVGGTWYWNTYPGARVDIESLEYSYAFDEALQQEWDWPERYAAQPDVLAYMQHVADRLDLRRDITFGTRVASLVYDETAGVWELTTDGGKTLRSRYAVTAVGFLSAAYLPDIPGRDSFGGQLVHSGQWPREGVDFAGKRVGIVGTGATGIQMIPRIAEQAGSLTVFQRSPMWAVPLQNVPMPPEYQARIKARYPELRRREHEESFAGNFLVDFDLRPLETRKAVEATPEEREEEYEFRWRSGGLCFYMSFSDLLFDPAANDTLREFFERKIRGIVRDQKTADTLIPTDHPPLTKRLAGETGYWEAFNRDDVHLVDTKADPIAEITPTGVRLESGAEHELDIIVFATGFDAGTGSLTRIDIVGRDGTTLADAWSEGARTLHGLTVERFPNLFMLDGPQSPAAFFSPPLLSDYQSQLIGKIIDRLDADGVRAIEPDPTAVQAWTELVDGITDTTLLTRANSWWLGANIPGKPRQSLYFLGGFPMYRDASSAPLEDGFAGYVLDGAPAAAAAS